LVAGHRYRVVIDADEASANMSDRLHFATYTGGTGGADGPFFDVNIASVKILARVP
jgi:hypothetical protein